jgi:hypothetical protein
MGGLGFRSRHHRRVLPDLARPDVWAYYGSRTLTMFKPYFSEWLVQRFFAGRWLLWLILAAGIIWGLFR